MSRLQKLKIENIKKANELLENGHNKQYPPQVVILKPSENVTNSSNSFVNKEQKIKEYYLYGVGISKEVWEKKRKLS